MLAIIFPGKSRNAHIRLLALFLAAPSSDVVGPEIATISARWHSSPGFAGVVGGLSSPCSASFARLSGNISRAKAPKTIEYLQGNPRIFQFDPDPKDDFTEEITIDPQLLILSPSPEAETGVYYNSQISNERQNITKHEKYHIKSWPCNVRNCTEKFSREGDLKRHLGEVHPESFPELAKIYQCPKADYETRRSGNLKRHIKTKHPNEPIPTNWRQVFLKRQ
ncbi:predicted protein [Histoplasma capsulatum H143]|uniref:C2H2-type domain-containing protein n=1 Tax=Ajellomyces capsulatus (strain H143) TaxID=544712 RepID=C6H3W8_AJECH|nr:predicted protein [Histoplasma capsulatum H143]